MLSTLSSKLAVVFFLTTLVSGFYIVKFHYELTEIYSLHNEQEKTLNQCLEITKKINSTPTVNLPEKNTSAIDMLKRAREQ
ncbi:hypothetical protein ACF0NV_003762 [Proteus mirabilis]|uniref:Uncharacterized protein n=2 Tax=Morganellaceae TaxID=1903414 RepID=A0A346H4W2_PROST|nr:MULTISPECIES: hypothetical protein [Enterobacterales]EDY5216576.1 hypothetical protein [Salmonella enterica]EFK5576950.1 hypothetical protein [Escherichia coli]EJG2204908.1 hypothetical protein [Morganella morganii]EKX8998702.1 hypothetical protein [Citrobacter freundii]HAN2841623.1 hypothetical protein [Escherichia coli O25b:H4-ST131]HBD3039820.1 hypothetical protein [Citrobacter koseri]